MDEDEWIRYPMMTDSHKIEQVRVNKSLLLVSDWGQSYEKLSRASLYGVQSFPIMLIH